MKRYIFFLLAFFLTFSAYSFTVTNGLFNIPSVSANTNSGIRQTSSRNVEELGNISESKEKANQPGVSETGSPTVLNGSQKDKALNTNKGTKTSMLTGSSCRTYEGEIYEKGQPGYSDCIRTIKNDRQGVKNIP